MGSYLRVVCVKSPHSLVSRSFGFWHKQAREYNPVQSTFYDVNYIFDKKTTEDDSGSDGNFGGLTASAREEWGEEAIRINRFVNYRLMFDSKLSFSLETWSYFFLLQITRIGATRISCSTGVVAFKKINIVLVVYSSWLDTAQGRIQDFF